MVTRSDSSFQLPSGTAPATIPRGRTPEDGVSFSGHERDRLFVNLGNGQFKDVSGVSGADDPGDGRVFALLDFDRDGWWDIAEVNSNAPSLKLYGNRFGSDPSWRATHHVMALRFVGGNRRDAPAAGLSNRDGFGAIVTVDLGDTKLVREHRAGEGFAAQNSATMLVGLGAHRLAEKVTVRWPSGQLQTLERVPAGRLVTIYEPGSDRPPGALVEMAAYTPSAAPVAKRGPSDGSPARIPIIDLPPDAGDPEIRVFVTFATWCQACRGDLPQFARLREAFPTGQLGLFAVPADENDDRSKLDEWMATQRPAYAMLFGLPSEQVAAIKQLLLQRLKREGLPSTVVTNRKGEVLKAMFGVPTVSDLRMLSDGKTPGH